MQDSVGAHWLLQLPQLLESELMSVSHPSEPSWLQSSNPMKHGSHSLNGLQKAPGQHSSPTGQGAGEFTHCASDAHGSLNVQSKQVAVAQFPGPPPCALQKSTHP